MGTLVAHTQDQPRPLRRLCEAPPARSQVTDPRIPVRCGPDGAHHETSHEPRSPHRLVRPPSSKRNQYDPTPPHEPHRPPTTTRLHSRACSTHNRYNCIFKPENGDTFDLGKMPLLKKGQIRDRDNLQIASISCWPCESFQRTHDLAQCCLRTATACASDPCLPKTRAPTGNDNRDLQAKAKRAKNQAQFRSMAAAWADKALPTAPSGP